MRISLKAANSKYLSAEQGGGLKYEGSYPNTNYPVTAPLYANRTEIGDWEKFDLITNPNGTVSFQTVNGFYITAEEGGGKGVSTNRMAANAWEQFTPEGKAYKCIDGIHYLGVEIGSDSHMNAIRASVGNWEEFTTEFLDIPDVIWPSIDKLREFSGNLCGLPLNLQYAPNGILFTPAYVVYDDATRDKIRKSYRDQGWTHFPLNLTNHSSIYRNYYPSWDDALINKYLTELLSSELIPVGFVMGDQDKEVNTHADNDLVPIVVPKWEDSAPIKRPAMDNDNTFYLVKNVFPESLLYWHNPPYQGAPYVEYHDWGLSPGDSTVNAKVWHYMVDICDVQGLLFQGKAWENDAKDSISVLTDFKNRLKDGVSGWPLADLVDFEETAYYMFNENGNYNQALQMSQKVRRNVWELNGFCNG